MYLYALIISALIYKTLGWKKLWGIIKKSAANTATLALLCGTSMLFSYIISLEQVPRVVASLVMGITDNRYVFLLICNIMFLILGMIFDNNTITLVFIPMIYPLVQGFGIDPVHFGVMFVINMMIGMVTPPYGPLLFVTSAISETPLKDIIKEILPMIAVMIAFLLVITYIPDVVLVLPKIFLNY